MTDRTTARVVGALFIVADLAGVLSVVFHQSDISSMNAALVATSALLVIAMAISVVGIAIVINPVLKRFAQRLALAYVALRTMEGMVNVISAIGALTLLTVSQRYTAGASRDASIQALGSVLSAQLDWVNNAVLVIVFGIDALVLNYVLYRARLVPSWLSAWGLGGAGLWLATGVFVAYTARSMDALALPIGLQELALAFWLIFKGFTAVDTAQPATRAA